MASKILDILFLIKDGINKRAGILWNRNLNKIGYFAKITTKLESKLRGLPPAAINTIYINMLHDITSLTRIDRIRGQLDLMKTADPTEEGLQALITIMGYTPSAAVPILIKEENWTETNIALYNATKTMLHNDRGGFGNIYKVKNTEGVDVAVKVIKMPDEYDTLELKALFINGVNDEIHALSTLSNVKPPIFPKFIASGNPDEQTFVIIFEWINGIHLYDFYYVKHPEERTEEFTKKYDANTALYDSFTRFEMVDVLKAVKRKIKQCHEMGYIHRDIKQENIMMKIINGELTIYLIDAGFTVPVNTKISFEGEGSAGYNPYIISPTPTELELTESLSAKNTIATKYPKQQKAVPNLNFYAFNRMLQDFNIKDESLRMTGGKRLKRRRTTKMAKGRRRRTIRRK